MIKQQVCRLLLWYVAYKQCGPIVLHMAGLIAWYMAYWCSTRPVHTVMCSTGSYMYVTYWWATMHVVYLQVIWPTDRLCRLLVDYMAN